MLDFHLARQQRHDALFKSPVVESKWSANRNREIFFIESVMNAVLVNINANRVLWDVRLEDV